MWPFGVISQCLEEWLRGGSNPNRKTIKPQEKHPHKIFKIKKHNGFHKIIVYDDDIRYISGVKVFPMNNVIPL